MIDPDDERTALSRRRSPVPPVDDVTELRTGGRIPATGVGPGSPTSEPAPDTAPAPSEAAQGPRRRGPAAPADEEATITRRRSRGRTETATQPVHRPAAAPGAPAVGGEVPLAAGRVARAPEQPAPYRARAPQPARSARQQPPPREPQAFVDTAAADARELRRRRRRGVLLVVAASVTALLAVTALAVLLTIG